MRFKGLPWNKTPFGSQYFQLLHCIDYIQLQSHNHPMIFSKISQKLAASAFFDDLHDPVVKLPKKLPSCVSIALNFQNAVAVWNSTAAPLGEESGISKTSCEISVKRFAKKTYVCCIHWRWLRRITSSFHSVSNGPWTSWNKRNLYKVLKQENDLWHVEYISTQ